MDNPKLSRQVKFELAWGSFSCDNTKVWITEKRLIN